VSVYALFKTSERPEGGTLSARLVAEVREAVFEKRLKPGDFLGTEKDIAERGQVSRMAARDALRTLAALGVVEIKVGAGGGVRIAHGNPRQFAEALAVQLDLAGISRVDFSWPGLWHLSSHQSGGARSGGGDPVRVRDPRAV